LIAMPSTKPDRTVEAVQLQVRAMSAVVFDVGLFKPDVRDGEAAMVPRVWDTDSLMRSIGWLRHENRDGRNIYVRPNGEHNLSLVDDLTAGAIAEMMRVGFAPAAIVETSPGNFQAWLKHPEALSKELGTAAARALAERFGGDRGAADWRHYGRLAGFTNRKEKYRDPATGLHPFVKLVRATGASYPAAQRFLSEVRTSVAEQREREQQRRTAWGRSLQSGGEPTVRFKSIDQFRSDPKYEGDGTRIDLAFAIYALSRGVATAEVEAAIRTRDLSHKGGDKRQADYVERTIKKALAVAERSRER
jgi:RepB DNA-primase from phage plasmid